jgi:hypothetical protein
MQPAQHNWPAVLGRSALACIVFSAVLLAQETLSERPNVPSLYYLAQQARSEGKSRIVVPPPVGDPLITSGLDDFVDDTVVVTATIRSGKTFLSGYYKDELTTWYTVRVASTSVLAGDRAPVVPPAGTVPEPLLPLAPGELLVAVSGGRLNIDGVEIISDSLMPRQFSVGHSYLLFLKPRGAGLPVTMVHGGPIGACELRDDSLRPLFPESSNPAASDIAARFHNSLREVSQGLASRPRTKADHN